MRRLLIALGVVSLCQPLGLTDARIRPSATIRLSTGSVAAGIGVSWGSGTLYYKGKAYPISVSGLDVGSVGASRISATGTVYHLRSLGDFDGTYAAAQAGATVGGGAEALAMKNQNGVTVHLTAISRGVELTLGGSGVKMERKR